MKQRIVQTRRRVTISETLAMTEALKKRGYTDAELGVAFGMSSATAGRWRRKLAEETGTVYVEDFGPDARGRLFVPVWRFGNGQNVERPGDAITPQERMAKLREDRKKGLK
jgi:hypothetical protein